jgi:signal transduction histidine kinase
MQRTAIILVCFIICSNSFAQQYPFVHYSPKDGLVNSRVKKAYQDSKGRMYFLTYGGLSVYDGARFRNYTMQNGLAMEIVNDILEIGNDSLLIATNTNQLNLLVNGKIEIFKIQNGNAPLVNHFYRHDDGIIYLSSDHGLFRLEKNKIETLNVSGMTVSKKDQPNLGNIAGAGNYLALTTNDMNYNKGLFLYDIKNDRICDTLNTSAYLLGKDERNRIWISSAHQLLITDNTAWANGKLLLKSPDDGFSRVKNYSTINAALGKNMIWVVYRNQEFRNLELHRIHKDGSLLSVLLPAQAALSYILNIFIDRENNIWLCNEGEGVFKIIRSPLQVIEKPLGLSAESQPASGYYQNGYTWYSTLSKKLYRQSSDGMKSFYCNLDKSPSIFYSDSKRILGNDNANIYEAYHEDQSGTVNFKKIISLPGSDLFGRRLLVDINGAIITGQKKGFSAWYHNKLIFFKPIDNKFEFIEELFIDNQNRLWMVMRLGGIEVFAIHSGNFSNYLQPLFKINIDQMPGSVRSCVMDKKGIIWIGTRDKGLAGYELKENKLEKLFHFNTGNGLSDNFITSLACDSSNNIIAGTQTGIDRIQYRPDKDYLVENLSKNNNLFAYIPRTWADKSHAYAMTNSGVLLQVSPTATEISTQLPSLLLEEIKVNAKTIVQHKADFTHKENNISFYVAAPSFIDEKQISYTYLLEGSGNNRWSDTTPVNSIINLTNLSSAKYVLKVKSFFPSGAYSPAELSYSFEITPPWWQTWWFRIGLAILAIVLLFAGIRFYYRRKLEKQMAVLEKQQAIEKERTRIATDMHDDLGAGLSRIKFLSETIGIKKQQDQPIEEDISKIREYSHEMIDKMGEIVWALNEKNDSLSDLLSYTRSYAVEYLSQNGINCRVETHDRFPSGFVSGEFRRNIYLTVKEALHNVVKHAQASEVIMKIEINHSLNIEIKDDGAGFDKSTVRAFSNGLSNMQSRIKEIGGVFELTNGNGTLIRIKVPLNG